MQKIKYFSTKKKSSLVRRSTLAESQSIMLSGGEKINLKRKPFFIVMTCLKSQNCGPGEICGFQGLEVKDGVTSGHRKRERLVVLMTM